MATKKAKAEAAAASDLAGTLAETLVSNFEESDAYPADDATPEDKRAAFDLYARQADAVTRQAYDSAVAIVRQNLLS